MEGKQEIRVSTPRFEGVLHTEGKFRNLDDKPWREIRFKPYFELEDMT